MTCQSLSKISSLPKFSILNHQQLILQPLEKLCYGKRVLKLPIPIFITLALTLLAGCQTVYARITPEDIVNAKREIYQQIIKKYSPQSQTKLTQMEQAITQVNQKLTDQLDLNMQTQAAILEEYVRRRGGTSDDIENARYWLTYAHEAVAFQAAKIYIFKLSSEKNLKGDVGKTISGLQSDLNILRGKVIKSQNITKTLVTSNK